MNKRILANTKEYRQNSSEEHFRTCAHGRTYPHVRMWGAVRNFCNFYCAGGVRCGMVKEMPPHPHFNGGKNLGKFLSIFPNFSKNVFPHRTVPHNSFKKFLRTAAHPTSLFFFRIHTAPHIRIPLNTCSLKEFYCAVGCGCGAGAEEK